LASYWNIAYGSGGVLHGVSDSFGNPNPETSVLWEANTFTDSSFDQIMFSDPDQRLLMSGYLDQSDPSIQSPTFIQITNIPSLLAGNYDVVIYTMTTVQNAFGQYSVNGSPPKYVVAGGNGMPPYNTDFVEATGDDRSFGMSDWGNYIVFRGLSGNTVTITATNESGGKAPVNGVQIAAAQ
jgi:hypothetical protein